MALDEVFRGGDHSDRSTLGETLPDATAGPMDTFEVKETKEALVKAVTEMADREKTVLTLYYYEGLTLAEIGDILGVTESRVCQIHTKAVLQLRAKLADRPEGAGRSLSRPGVQGDGTRRRPRPPLERALPRRPGAVHPDVAPLRVEDRRRRALPWRGPTVRWGARAVPSTHPAASTVAPLRGCCSRGNNRHKEQSSWPSSP